MESLETILTSSENTTATPVTNKDEENVGTVSEVVDSNNSDEQKTANEQDATNEIVEKININSSEKINLNKIDSKDDPINNNTDISAIHLNSTICSSSNTIPSTINTTNKNEMQTVSEKQEENITKEIQLDTSKPNTVDYVTTSRETLTDFVDKLIETSLKKDSAKIVKSCSEIDNKLTEGESSSNLLMTSEMKILSECKNILNSECNLDQNKKINNVEMISNENDNNNIKTTEIKHSSHISEKNIEENLSTHPQDCLDNIGKKSDLEHNELTSNDDINLYKKESDNKNIFLENCCNILKSDDKIKDPVANYSEMITNEKNTENVTFTDNKSIGKYDEKIQGSDKCIEIGSQVIVSSVILRTPDFSRSINSDVKNSSNEIIKNTKKVSSLQSEKSESFNVQRLDKYSKENSLNMLEKSTSDRSSKISFSQTNLPTENTRIDPKLQNVYGPCSIPTITTTPNFINTSVTEGNKNKTFDKLNSSNFDIKNRIRENAYENFPPQKQIENHNSQFYKKTHANLEMPKTYSNSNFEQFLDSKQPNKINWKNSTETVNANKQTFHNSNLPGVVNKQIYDHSNSSTVVNNSLVNLHMRPPNFNKVNTITSAADRSLPMHKNDLLVTKCPSSNEKVTPQNFEEMSKRYNYIKDLRLKHPDNKNNTSPNYSNLYMKPPDFSTEKFIKAIPSKSSEEAHAISNENLILHSEARPVDFNLIKQFPQLSHDVEMSVVSTKPKLSNTHNRPAYNNNFQELTSSTNHRSYPKQQQNEGYPTLTRKDSVNNESYNNNPNFQPERQLYSTQSTNDTYKMPSDSFSGYQQHFQGGSIVQQTYTYNKNETAHSSTETLIIERNKKHSEYVKHYPPMQANTSSKTENSNNIQIPRGSAMKNYGILNQNSCQTPSIGSSPHQKMLPENMGTNKSYINSAYEPNVSKSKANSTEAAQSNSPCRWESQQINYNYNSINYNPSPTRGINSVPVVNQMPQNPNLNSAQMKPSPPITKTVHPPEISLYNRSINYQQNTSHYDYYPHQNINPTEYAPKSTENMVYTGGNIPSSGYLTPEQKNQPYYEYPQRVTSSLYHKTSGSPSNIPKNSFQNNKSNQKPNYREMLSHAYAVRNSTTEDDLNLQIIKRTLNRDVSLRKTENDLSKSIFDTPLPSNKNNPSTSKNFYSNDVNNYTYGMQNIEHMNYMSSSPSNSMPSHLGDNTPLKQTTNQPQPVQIIPRNDISVTLSKITGNTHENAQIKEKNNTTAYSLKDIGNVKKTIESKIDSTTPQIRPAESTNNANFSSPLDLSVKTVKTKADSTGCDDANFYKQRSMTSSSYSAPKIDFQPNFNSTDNNNGNNRPECNNSGGAHNLAPIVNSNAHYQNIEPPPSLSNPSFYQLKKNLPITSAVNNYIYNARDYDIKHQQQFKVGQSIESQSHINVPILENRIKENYPIPPLIKGEGVVKNSGNSPSSYRVSKNNSEGMINYRQNEQLQRAKSDPNCNRNVICYYDIKQMPTNNNYSSTTQHKPSEATAPTRHNPEFTNSYKTESHFSNDQRYSKSNYNVGFASQSMNKKPNEFLRLKNNEITYNSLSHQNIADKTVYPASHQQQKSFFEKNNVPTSIKKVSEISSTAVASDQISRKKLKVHHDKLSDNKQVSFQDLYREHLENPSTVYQFPNQPYYNVNPTCNNIIQNSITNNQSPLKVSVIQNVTKNTNDNNRESVHKQYNDHLNPNFPNEQKSKQESPRTSYSYLSNHFPEHKIGHKPRQENLILQKNHKKSDTFSFEINDQAYRNNDLQKISSNSTFYPQTATVIASTCSNFSTSNKANTLKTNCNNNNDIISLSNNNDNTNISNNINNKTIHNNNNNTKNNNNNNDNKNTNNNSNNVNRNITNHKGTNNMRGASENVISKIRSSIEQRGADKQKSLNNSVERTHGEDESEKSDIASLLAARIRTKGELKGFVSPPASSSTLIKTYKDNTQSELTSLPSSDVKLSEETPTNDSNSVVLDLMDWGSTCNDFVEQLTGTNKKRGKRKKIPRLLEEFKKDGSLDNLENFPGLEYKCDIDQPILQQIKNECITNDNVKVETFNSSDEDKPLNVLRQQSIINTDEKLQQNVCNPIVSAQPISVENKPNNECRVVSEKLENGGRNIREKLRIEQEKRLAARIGKGSSSESDNVLDAKRNSRPKKFSRKPRSKTSNTSAREVSETDSSDGEDNIVLRKLRQSRAEAQKRKNSGPIDSDCGFPKEPKKPKLNESLDETSKTTIESQSEKRDILTKAEMKFMGPSVVQPLISSSSDIQEESKSPQKTQTQKTATEMNTPKKNLQGSDMDKKQSKRCTTTIENKKQCETNTEGVRYTDKTMTRSKKKKELEKEIAESKILRNDKIVKNTVVDRKSKITAKQVPNSPTNAMSKSKSIEKQSKYDNKEVDKKNISTNNSDIEKSSEDPDTLSDRLRTRITRSAGKNTNTNDNKINKLSKIKVSKKLNTSLKCVEGKKKNKLNRHTISKFPPGWEHQVYEFKKSLKIPLRLITIKGPARYRMSTSLPDLDSHSSDDDNSQDKSNKNWEHQDKNLKASKIEDVVTTPKEESPPKSIIDVLHSRALKLKRLPKKPTKTISNNNDSKCIPKSNNEDLLLPTPSVDENDSCDNNGHFSVFNTEILKSRTRTESRIMKRQELIREVFGGEDRPASAPPEILNMDEKEEKMTFEKKYEQYLEKMNVDFGTKIRKVKNFEISKDKSIEAQCDNSLNENKLEDSSAIYLTNVDEISQDLDTEKSFRNPITIKEHNLDTKSETHSAISEHEGLNTRLLLKQKKSNKYRRKGSSGFDYIRKKKKPPSNNPDSFKRRRIISPSEFYHKRTEGIVSKEVKNWVLNKSVGQSALHKAARLGYLDVIAYCLEKLNMNPDPKDNAGYTPLHEACSKGQIDIARLLLQYGANHSQTAHSGIRPLHEASENGYVEIVRLLLSYGADPLLTTYSGQTPLMLAENPAMEQFINNHLQDVQNTGPHKQPWKLPGPWKIYDPDEYGFDILNGASENNGMDDCENEQFENSSLRKLSLCLATNLNNVSHSNISIDATDVKLRLKPTVEWQGELKRNRNNFHSKEKEIDEEIFEFEESEIPLPPLYLLRDEGSEKWILLSDLCNLLKIKSKDTLLKQMYPCAPPANVIKELLRELKISDFLEKATCLQLLCAGEKINIRASKVVLVKYNERVQDLLGVKTIVMKF